MPPFPIQMNTFSEQTGIPVTLPRRLPSEDEDPAMRRLMERLQVRGTLGEGVESGQVKGGGSEDQPAGPEPG